MGAKNAFVAVGIIAVVLLFAALIIGGRGGYTYNIYNIGTASSAADEAGETSNGSSSDEATETSSSSSYSGIEELVSDSRIVGSFNKVFDWFKGYVSFVVSGTTLDVIIKAAFVSLLLFALSYAVQVIRVLLMGMGVFTVLLAIAAILGIIG
ncbi:hypothetical protein DRJ17_07125 [Candidatus Woesearchaeota archaeon]|nr:MAG: hypothetical protein DRJ17_07125 [Candidatus Woesearchaeota archaeon]